MLAYFKMKSIIGGGPRGCLRHPQRRRIRRTNTVYDSTVYDTFGWGVVFSGDLANLRAAEESHSESQKFSAWEMST